MISRKYKNAVSVTVNYNNSEDPKARDEAVLRAIKKLDGKLQKEGWRFDVERQRAHLNRKERRILKHKLIDYRTKWNSPAEEYYY